MNRARVLSIVLAAAVAGACGGADSTSSSPTAPSSTPSTTPPQTQPQPQTSCVPTNLAVASIQGTVVTLQWNAVSGATEYTVLVGSTSGSADRLSTNTTNTNYTWTASKGLQYGRVQAKCNGVYGGSSNEVAFTVS
jgi:hypothetical protein